MVSGLVALVLGCSPLVPYSWEKQSGEHVLRMDVAEAKPTERVTTLTLLTRKDAHRVWSMPYEFMPEGAVLLDPNAERVALVYAREGVIRFLDAEGRAAGKVNLGLLLNDEEVLRLPLSTCGRLYFERVSFVGQKLEVWVDLNGGIRWADQPDESVKFVIDPKTRKAEREHRVKPSPPPNRVKRL